MDENTALERLKELHREIELDAGENPDSVGDDICPLDALGGFDSTLIPNIIRGLAKSMGVTLAKGKRLRNPYVGSDGTTKLTLRGVAKRFCELYGKEGKAA